MSDPRIVSLVPSLTELICDLGLAQRLVGRTGYCIHPSQALAAVPKVGGTKTVNIEKIRRLAPTHLIVNIDENEKPTVDQLASFVPNVIVTHPIEVEDNFELYRRFGNLFGAQGRADQLCESLAAALSEIDACRFDPLPVAYLIWNDPWMTVSTDTFIARMLARVGLEARAPANTARYPSLSSEVIASIGARALLLSSEPCRFTPADRQTLRRLLAAAGRERVPVLGIDGEMTSWYGPRAIAGLHYLRAYRERLDRRLAPRASGRTRLAPAPTSVRAAGVLAFTLVLGALTACSSAPPASSPAAGAQTPGTTGAAAARGRFYLDDGPGDRPLAELAKTPDAVPKAEPLHPRANRPYTVFGQTYEPMTRLEPFRERGIATWYGRRYHGRPTSIGEPYDMYGMTAAHPTLPLPSYARVTHVRSGRSIVVRVNDRGPFLHGRVIDLSYAAAAKLASALPGSAEVEVELITRFDEPAAPSVAGAGAPEPTRVQTGAAASASAVQVVPVTLTSVPALGADERIETPEPAPAAAVPGARAVAAAAAERTGAGPDMLPPGRYVQLGAYQTREGAEAALQRLRARGLSEPVAVRRDGSWHKLVAGPYAQPADAQEAQRRLRAATGIDAFVLLR